MSPSRETSRPHIYTDGGLLSANPSNRGGTWGWVRVVDDEIIAEGAGWIPASEMPGGTVSSNQAEFRAVLEAFRDLPDEAVVVVCVDSEVTLGRWYGTGVYGRTGIPDSWWEGMNAELRRHGGSNWVQLAGHPSVRPGSDGLTDLERGYKLTRDGQRGLPVSKWNVYVDRLCTAQAVLANILLDCDRLGDDDAWAVIAQNITATPTEG